MQDPSSTSQDLTSSGSKRDRKASFKRQAIIDDGKPASQKNASLSGQHAAHSSRKASRGTFPQVMGAFGSCAARFLRLQRFRWLRPAVAAPCCKRGTRAGVPHSFPAGCKAVSTLY
jgi:hypothetical protein